MTCYLQRKLVVVYHVFFCFLQLTLEGIKQFYIAIELEEWKLETLCDLYDTLSIAQAVIFCNTRRKVIYLLNNLMHTKLHYKKLLVCGNNTDYF